MNYYNKKTLVKSEVYKTIKDPILIKVKNKNERK